MTKSLRNGKISFLTIYETIAWRRPWRASVAAGATRRYHLYAADLGTSRRPISTRRGSLFERCLCCLRKAQPGRIIVMVSDRLKRQSSVSEKQNGQHELPDVS